ncbi:hypothetical protein BCR34DRAFT_313779 [Clohesyomyces aquaticus]|uniref:Uncharacterized protein n=1 Tax=Clohesyomyces aquaticus TaxID=1231657 RepID=A0A1Y1ZQ39_9PLEO|nr:hypothetical protein BCR34DRAFT_313779 [Clohesyomyces aquaticus]
MIHRMQILSNSSRNPRTTYLSTASPTTRRDLHIHIYHEALTGFYDSSRASSRSTETRHRPPNSPGVKECSANTAPAPEWPDYVSSVKDACSNGLIGKKVRPVPYGFRRAFRAVNLGADRNPSTRPISFEIWNQNLDVPGQKSRRISVLRGSQKILGATRSFLVRVL